jgi:hypothetical protein
MKTVENNLYFSILHASKELKNLAAYPMFM